MSTHRRTLSSGIAAFVAVVMWSAGGVVNADDGDSAQAADAASAIESLRPVADAEPTVEAQNTNEGLVAASDGNVTVISDDPSDGITLTSADGVEVQIDLPGAHRADEAAISDNTTAVYTDALPGASVAAQAIQEGVRALVVIENSAAPNEYRFPITAPEGTTLEKQEDGSINLVGADGTPFGNVAAPWAIDATGAPVATAFRIDGMTVIQSVQPDESAAYPIVIDPKFTWGWVTGTAYFNKAETKTIASAGWGAASLTSVCALVGAAFGGPVGAAAMGAACFVYSATIVYTAGVANNSRPSKCLKIKVIPAIPTILQPGTYSGGYCK